MIEILYFFNKIKWAIEKYTQRIFRKSHMSDSDICEFHITISKWLMPKLLQYKKYVGDAFPDTSVPEHADILGRTLPTKSEFNEIMFALEWAIKTNPHTYTKEQNNFFIKYFDRTPYSNQKIGDFNSGIDPKDDLELVNEARKRAQKGFETLGYHFTNLGDEL
jgi:hypothetical protein